MLLPPTNCQYQFTKFTRTKPSLYGSKQCGWFKGRVKLQICENRRCRHYILHWVTCHCVIFDIELIFAVHICRSSLAQLRVVRRTLTNKAAKTIVHAFITSCINYCNNVFSHASSIHIRPLQSILHLAVQLITRQWKHDSIIPTIWGNLYWLPIPKKMEFKLCTFVYKCLHGMAPTYLTNAMHTCLNNLGAISPSLGCLRWTICSSLSRKAFGSRNFSVSRPKPGLHYRLVLKNMN